MRGRALRLSFAVLEAALAASLAVTLVGCSSSTPSTTTKEPTSTAASGEPIKIGVVVSLTGTYAGLGEPEKNTLEMEVARINDAGGVKGRKVELVIEDDGTDEAKAVAATSKLIDQDKVVAVIGATGTGQTMAMRGDIERASVPQVSMAGGTVITNPVAPLVFATPWSNMVVVPVEFEAMKKAGITKIALISDSGGFGKDGVAVIEKKAPEFGISVVGKETFNPGDTDFSAQLTKLKNSKAQALVLWSAGKEAAAVVKQARDLGIKIPIYGSHGNARAEFIAGAGPAGEGVIIAAGKILAPETYGTDSEAYKVATDFTKRYEDKFGASPSTFAGHAYDALHLIVDAAGRVSGEITPAGIRDELEKTAGFIGIGGTFDMSAQDHNGLGKDDLQLYVIEGGKFKPIK